MAIIIGVDIGTSNIKVIAFKNNNQVRISEISACAIIQPSAQRVEQSPEVVLKTVNVLLKSVIDKHNGETINGICFSSAMHSILAVDKDHQPITNAILWSDTRSRKEAHQLEKSGVAEKLYRQTGVPVHPSLPLCKIIWLRNHVPHLFSGACKFISLKEYLFFQWFRQYITDYSIAGATGMMDIQTLQWSKDAMEIAGIKEEQLSPIVPVTHIEKELTPYYKNLFGIEDIPFIIGSSDGCLANLGSNVLSSEKAALTIGTSGAIRSTISSPLLNDSPTLFCYPLLDNIYIKGGAVNNGGNILSWFGKQFMINESHQSNHFTSLIEKAHAVEAGADGLIFLPYLYGERAPIWDANARGVFFGINGLHNQAHFIRAVLEGICFGLYDIFSELALKNKEIKTIYASGGFIQSDAWVQMIADVFNIEVCVQDQADASALGAAVIGRLATGLIKDIETSLSSSKNEKVYTPDRKKHQIYLQNFRVFKSLYKSLKSNFSDPSGAWK